MDFEPNQLAAHVAVHCLTKEPAAARLSGALSAAGVNVQSLLVRLRDEVDAASEIMPGLEDRNKRTTPTEDVPAERIDRLVTLFGTNKITGMQLRESLEVASQPSLLDFVMNYVAGWNPPRSRPKTAEASAV